MWGLELRRVLFFSYNAACVRVGGVQGLGFGACGWGFGVDRVRWDQESGFGVHDLRFTIQSLVVWVQAWLTICKHVHLQSRFEKLSHGTVIAVPAEKHGTKCMGLIIHSTFMGYVRLQHRNTSLSLWINMGNSFFVEKLTKNKKINYTNDIQIFQNTKFQSPNSTASEFKLNANFTPCRNKLSRRITVRGRRCKGNSQILCQHACSQKLH